MDLQAMSDEPSDTLGENNYQAEKIRAVSDFAPIQERVKRSPKRRKDIVREGYAYHISRWPLLVRPLASVSYLTNTDSDCWKALIFLLIFLEFVAYVLVRQLVNVIEYFSACTCFP
jgi:hypothetical protein